MYDSVDLLEIDAADVNAYARLLAVNHLWSEKILMSDTSLPGKGRAGQVRVGCHSKAKKTWIKSLCLKVRTRLLVNSLSFLKN